MKFNFLLGSFAILLLSACGAQRGDDPGAGAGDHGASGGNSDAGVPPSHGDTDAGDATDDGESDAGVPTTGGDLDAGVSTSRGGSGAGMSTGHGDGDAAGSKNDGESDGDAAGSPDDGDAGASNTDGDANGEGGYGGVSTSGSAGRAGSGGKSSIDGTGGTGGLSTSGGTGGTGGLPSSAGSGGLPDSAGSGGLPASGGSSGVAGSGPAGGSAGDGNGGVSLDPEYLFTKETFGGNGRTCITCHTADTGTVSPDQIQTLYSTDPSGPLFRSIDSDDGASDDYTQLEDHATFRVTIDLPAGVSLTSDPGATSVVFRRGVPTTINTPALDPVIMWDGRAADLVDQAQGAISGHAQATVIPTATQLDLITQFEQGPDFFSSDILQAYSQGGPAPTWPAGNTAEEQRGRRWFAQDSAAPRFNICGQCHGGPMANTTQSNSGLPVGKRFQTVNVSEFNTLGNPTYQFTFPDPKNPGKTVTVVTPDPGRALITGDVRDLNFFKIPTLWGIKNTAPYFHDNSANTLEDLMDHYQKHLATFLSATASYPTPHVPTAQDKTDIIAFLKLL